MIPDPMMELMKLKLAPPIELVFLDSSGSLTSSAASSDLWIRNSSSDVGYKNRTCSLEFYCNLLYCLFVCLFICY